jgi:hypothetical protein
MPSVVTNVIAAFAITTTRLAPVPCPDGIEGCCVLHTESVSETRYEPVKVSEKDCDHPSTSRGIALSTNALCNALSYTYWNRKLPTLIPIRALKGDDVHFEGHLIGFLIGDAVKKECGFNEPYEPIKKEED